MRILAVDQARHGGWAVLDCGSKELVDYGTWSFDGTKYPFAKAVMKIEELVSNIIQTHSVDAVYIEDIQLRSNVATLKKLAQLQGVLINLCEKNEYTYSLVSPSSWQSFCLDYLRRINERNTAIPVKKSTKRRSIRFARAKYGVDTNNDNLADALGILAYAADCVERLSDPETTIV